MRLLRFGICALIVFAVAAHGGVEDWARAVLETGAGFLLLAWALWIYFTHQEQIVFSPLVPPLAVLSLVACGQWFFHGTASSYDTRMELLLLVSDLILVFLAVQAFRTLQDWRGFVWFGMVFGFFICIFGILQQLTFNGKLYWFREMHYGGIPFGPYANRNHFAGFAELVLPLALVPLVLGKVRRERWPVVSLFVIVAIGVLLLSASRGGIVSFGVELAVLALAMILRRTIGKQLLAGAVGLALAELMFSWLGVGQDLHGFSSFQTRAAPDATRASIRLDTCQR